MTLPPITEKQRSILLLIFKFRFLHRIHIQTLLHHKTFNRINAWLKDLTDKKYIGRMVDTTATIKITPSIYYLSLNGIRYMRTQSSCEPRYLKKIYKEGTRSEDFIQRCLFIADIYIDLLQKYTDTSGFAFYTPSDYSIDGIIKELSPHCVFKKKENKPYYVVEIFNDNTPRYAIKARINTYITFFTKGEWIKNEEPPHILFICPNNKLEEYILKKAQTMLIDKNTYLYISVSTVDHIKKYGVEAEIWRTIEVDS